MTRLLQYLSALAALLIAALASGCLSMEPRYHEVYIIPSFKLHVVDGGTMKAEYRKLAAAYGEEQPACSTPWGFRDTVTGDVWVYCTSRRTGQPDMRALGEEVWHAPTAGGDFHPSLRTLPEIDRPAPRSTAQ